MQATLALYQHRLQPGADVVLPAVQRMVYAVDGDATVDDAPLAANQARLVGGACRLAASTPVHVLCWELWYGGDLPDGSTLAADVDLDDPDGYLMRCDRVDFPPGGVAFLHTHQGPGIRCLILGSFKVETGGHTLTIAPFEAWFEAGPDPVYAEVAGDAPSAFVRVMLLPRRLKGQSSIRYVNEADQAKPKSQRYTVFVDAFIDL